MGKFFDELMESVQQMDEIVRRERQPSREITADQSADPAPTTWKKPVNDTSDLEKPHHR
ncbi:hypothetical protein SAMN04490182_2802 [Pseudomonas cedrina]|uniref:Transcriptional regulator n=1 Tax=Pseudomonas cedrina TaxID=651740 RepID=A0ABY0UN40_PSECE|nr:hypothetical protein SAMN04490182_2802 [Pseudomonas cedrina]